MNLIYDHHIDLFKNELKFAVIHNRTSHPPSPKKGQIYYNTVDDMLYYWNGTVWIGASGGGGGSSAPVIEWRFEVAAGTQVEPGYTSFYLFNEDGTPLINKKVDIYREGELQTENRTHKGFNYNISTGQITNMNPAAFNGEDFTIKAYPLNSYIIIEGEGYILIDNIGGGYIMIDDTEKLLI